jgi:hypothetical protein
MEHYLVRYPARYGRPTDQADQIKRSADMPMTENPRDQDELIRELVRRLIENGYCTPEAAVEAVEAVFAKKSGLHRPQLRLRLQWRNPPLEVAGSLRRAADNRKE